MTYFFNVQSKGKGKGKFQTVTCHERHRGGVKLLLLFSLTSVLDGGGVNATSRPLYPPKRDTVPVVLEAGWIAGPVWTSEENLASTGIRSIP